MNFENLKPGPRFFTGLAWAFLFLAQLPQAYAFDHAHATFAEVLQGHVRADGRVDYAALKQNPQKLLQYLETMAAVDEAAFRSWDEKQQLAYLINLYNAQTLKLILDHYPVESIRDIGMLFMGPWDMQIVPLFGRKVSLDYVEHGILRKQYQEPRIHFALVCAAKGCPPLRREPYAAEKLEAQLEEQGRIFLATPHKNHIDSQKKTVYLSPIFKWFKKDFQAKHENILDFIVPYLPADIATEITDQKYDVKYMDYDWTLNAPDAAG
jgi:hypothetical protein